MTLRIQCNHCQKALKVPESLCGKAIRCPHCQQVTRVPEAKTRTTEVPPKPRPAAVPGRRAAAPPRTGNPRPSRQQDDQDGNFPQRSRSRDDWDDDAPRRPRAKKKSGSALIWLAAGGTVLAALAAVGYFFILPAFNAPPLAKKGETEPNNAEAGDKAKSA